MSNMPPFITNLIKTSILLKKLYYDIFSIFFCLQTPKNMQNRKKWTAFIINALLTDTEVSIPYRKYDR